jgi:PHD and RING finger domain-containing protein 1
VSYSSRNWDSERCPICLVTFAEQEIGTPDSCVHIFCVGCLEQWSKHANTCPVDRQEFHVILVRRYSDRRIIRRIPARPRPRPQLRLPQNQYERIVPLGVPYCQLCGRFDHGGRMITCNGCLLVYHAECLIPLVVPIPLVEWLCPVCVMLGRMFYLDYAMRRRRRI